MRRRPSHWFDLLTSLGEAGWELARAEVRVVSAEVEQAGRKLVGALLLILVALFALFWAIGVLAMVLTEVAALWLPRWGAALVVLGLFVLVGGILALVARRRVRSIEPPAETVKRRLHEHRGWWDRKIAISSRSPAGGSAPKSPSEARSGESENL